MRFFIWICRFSCFTLVFSCGFRFSLVHCSSNFLVHFCILDSICFIYMLVHVVRHERTCSFLLIVVWFSCLCACCQTWSFVQLLFGFHFCVHAVNTFICSFVVLWIFVSRSLCHCPSVAVCCLMFVPFLYLRHNLFKTFGWGARQALLMNKIRYMPWIPMKIQMKTYLAMNISYNDLLKWKRMQMKKKWKQINM